MTTLPKLLSLAKRHTHHETRAKWKTAHLANVIRGKYGAGDMREMSLVTHRSTSTLYKWGLAAELHSLLVQVLRAEPRQGRAIGFEILRRATAELSPWFFVTAWKYWTQNEDLWGLLSDLDTAMSSGWSIGDFAAHLENLYNPIAPSRNEQAEAHILKGLQLLQTTLGDGQAEVAARLKGNAIAAIVGLNGDKASRGAWALVRVLETMIQSP